jgi:plastocyanin
LVLATAFAAGCGSSSSSSSKADTTSPSDTSAQTTSPSGPADAATITIKTFKFGDPITVKAGATVTVKNADMTTHTVLADDKSFDTGDIAGGSDATFVAPNAGTYEFHCNIHNYMRGTLNVTS